MAQTVAQTTAQDGPSRAALQEIDRRTRRGNRRRDRRRAATTGCLIRDHLTFNFRRRWPARLVRLGLPGFLRASLRTDVLSEAMTRTAALIAAMEQAEAKMMSECVTRPVQPEEARAIANEIIRAEIARMLKAEADPTPRLAADVDARIAALSAEIAALREGLRLRDYAAALPAARQAAADLGVGADAATPVVAREAAAALVAMREVERAVEAGATVEEATRAVRADRFGGAAVDALGTAVRLSAAIEHAVEKAISDDVARKIRGTGALMLAHGDDRPIDLVFDRGARIARLHWMARLPRDRGKAHGRNAHEKVGRDICPHAEIAEADAHDAEVRAGVAARDDLSLAEKRRVIATESRARINFEQLEKHHSFEKRIFDAARDLGWAAPAWEPVISIIKKDIRRDLNRSDDDLAMRVMQTKKRASWSDELTSRLYNSPIYRGSSTRARRWKPGKLIVRDHFYWVPLIRMHMGTRIEEALRLMKSDVTVRNGIACLRIEPRDDSGLKTDAADRLLPIPGVLLRLGFMEWWRDQLEKPGSELFPDIQIGADGTKASIYGKRRATLYAHLDLLDAAEEDYAVRMTLSSRLTQVGATDGEREALLGHEHEKIVNRHDTEQHLPRLKALLDRVDFGIEIVDDQDRGHPVIARCTLGDRPTLDITATLDGNGSLTYLKVVDPLVGEEPIMGLPIPRPGEKVDDTLRERVERMARILFRRAKTCTISVRNRKSPDVRDPAAERAVASFIALGMVSTRTRKASVTSNPTSASLPKPAA
jgi:hypothetical protein